MMSNAGLRSIALWTAVSLAMILPVVVAAYSPLLQWREPIYIVGGFAGILGLSLMLAQPLLATGALPGLTGKRGRTVHKWIGAALFGAVVLHVAGLWITSPPDVVDALLFRSPTPFAVWGVLAMWAVFASAGLAVMRARLRPRMWRLAHSGLVLVIVTGTVLHALLIEGAMGTVTKVLLCALVVAATVVAIGRLRVWLLLRRRG